MTIDLVLISIGYLILSGLLGFFGTVLPVRVIGGLVGLLGFYLLVAGFPLVEPAKFPSGVIVGLAGGAAQGLSYKLRQNRSSVGRQGGVT